jgi:hypothetical protein
VAVRGRDQALAAPLLDLLARPAVRAARRAILDLYAGTWQGERLHPGEIDRLQGTWSNMTVVHPPIHAAWVNQAEIYFSVVQRKVLTPDDFADRDTLEQHLLAFGRHYEQIAAPFQWKFTREDLHKLLAKTDAQPASLAA